MGELGVMFRQGLLRVRQLADGKHTRNKERSQRARFEVSKKGTTLLRGLQIHRAIGAINFELAGVELSPALTTNGLADLCLSPAPSTFSPKNRMKQAPREAKTENGATVGFHT